MQQQFLTWRDAIWNALQSFLKDIAVVIPNIIAAIIVLIIGFILASLLGRLVKHLIDLSKLDSLLQKAVGIQKLREKGLKMTAASLVGWAVKWFFIIVTFIAVADILKWDQLTNFFQSVALYVPNVIIAVLILLAGFILGGGLKDIIVKAVKASSLPQTSAGLLGTVARAAVIIFAIMAALTQLGVASDLVKILFTGFVAMIALAGGLSFGLGGRDHATEWLNKIKREIQH